MKFSTQVAVATYVTFFGLVVLSVVLIVVLTRNASATDAPPFVTPPPPYVTPVPPPVQTVLLKDPGTNLCYQFDNLAPRLSSPEACTGYWLVNTTANAETLTFDGQTYETCVQPPAVPGTNVLGTVGAGCARVTLTDGVVEAPTVGLCITVGGGGGLTWGSCASPFRFAVVGL